jgi:RTA1 like protein
MFMVSDFFSLLLQAGGGAVVEIANDMATERVGIRLTVAGLGLQVASLGLLLLGCADFGRRCQGKGSMLSAVDAHGKIRTTKMFKVLLGGKLISLSR